MGNPKQLRLESVQERRGSIVRKVGSFLKMASYYDIDDILVEEQQAVNGVDIDPSAETHCVEPGSKISSFVRTKLELGADGASVDLRSRCLYFYEFGCKIAPL
ncbi:hypothetical protein Pyn_39422 [Prunus yedoensis var. nudiflora]|uniref:Uncharacterized protein n=1 Tax=Prunus yedoensis var. nudiflora TaxID=2094558 RepID=A0A314Z9E9_PRUYE|nr:hypothetical protein Pyn_39422 [Prunus yedoensis var. nudiflora]